MKISRQFCIETFSYDEKTGKLFWRRPTSNQVVIGQEVGCDNGGGYRKVGLSGKRHYVHRIVWFMYHGEWPAGDIDHINGDKSDNRLTNLRSATRSENSANSKQRSKHPKGVTFHRKTQTWNASITVNYRKISLGYHKSPESAHEAYIAAAKKHFGEFARAS